jgi:hypothetical protein
MIPGPASTAAPPAPRGLGRPGRPGPRPMAASPGLAAAAPALARVEGHWHDRRSRTVTQPERRGSQLEDHDPGPCHRDSRWSQSESTRRTRTRTRSEQPGFTLWSGDSQCYIEGKALQVVTPFGWVTWTASPGSDAARNAAGLLQGRGPLGKCSSCDVLPANVKVKGWRRKWKRKVMGGGNSGEALEPGRGGERPSHLDSW